MMPRQAKQVRGGKPTTRLQDAAYDAQWAAGLPTSELGRALLGGDEPVVPLGRCREYVETVRAAPWFAAAFPGQAGSPLVVVGGRGRSAADRDERFLKIGIDDRRSLERCEQACLHELAHLVTPDRGPDGELREATVGEETSRGHHHAWRANFVLIVRMMLGGPAASRLRHEFNHWGLPTR